MNWDELTMAQKNELMQTYIRNGVTSLDNMRSHFNSFALGGNKDNPDDPPTSKIPTRNEYLAQRAAEEQELYYLQGSRNRTEPYDVKIPVRNEDRQIAKQKLIAEQQYLNTLIKGLAKNANISIFDAKRLLDGNTYPVKWAGEYDFWFNQYNNTKKNIRDFNEIINNDYMSGSNCLATATSNNPNPGHFEAGNISFMKNHRYKGHEKVEREDAKPGAIVQLPNKLGQPGHAVILDHISDGDMYVNYSNGDDIYKKNQKLWDTPVAYYNFVGNHQDSVRWNNEYDQLYGNHKLGGYLFATGGPKDPPTVLPVNEEGLPYYILPDVDIVTEVLPQAKATDANIQRYADAVAKGQLKLSQIPNTELRNRVRAVPIMDQWYKDMDRNGTIAAAGLAGTMLTPYLVSGATMATPVVSAVMNNPIVDAGLTIHGAVTAPKNIKEGVQELQEGNYSRGALDLGLTTLDLYGAGKLMKHGYNAFKRLTGALAKQKNRLHEASYTGDNPFKSDASTNDLFSRIIGEDYYRQIFNNENPLISLNKLNKGEDFREIPISQKSKERFEKQVFPRLFADPERAEMFDFLYGSEASKELAKRQIMEDLYSQKQYITRPRIYEAVESVSGKASGTTAGMHYPEKGTLLKDTNKSLNDILDYAEGHELRHELQDIAPRTSTEEKILKDAYSDVPNPYSYDYDMSMEWETMNFDARKALGNRWPKIFNDDIAIQNKVIDKIEDKDFIEIIENSDSYWQEYIKHLREQGVDLKSKIPAWKEAMKKVGMIVTPVAIGASISKSED